MPRDDSHARDGGDGGPLVSVVMANWRGAAHIGAAVGSVLGQTAGDLELLVSDDGSDDGSEEAARAAAAGDGRLRWLPGGPRGGPSRARNRALDVARGRWVAIMDSDDLLHPRRLEILLALAERAGVEAVADDLAHFGDAPGSGGRTLLQPLDLAAPLAVDAPLFVRSNTEGGGLPGLGYLKPLVRRDALGALRYDPALRVGEDYDLVLRLLLTGARLLVSPLPLYLYRRHGASISHRLSVAVLEPLLAAHRPQEAGAPAGSPLREALARRGRALERALRYERLVAALKGRRPARAAGLVAGDPALLGLLAGSAREGLGRRWATRAAPLARGGEAARLAVLSAGQALPPDLDGAARDGALPAAPLVDAGAPDLRRLVCRLTEEASRRPVRLTAVGAEALDAALLLPGGGEVWLDPAEAGGRPLPSGWTLRAR